VGDSGPWRARLVLDAAHAVGAIVLCPVVSAELRGYPRRSQQAIDALLAATRICIAWTLTPGVWRQVGEAFAADVAWRRATGLDHPGGCWRIS